MECKRCKGMAVIPEFFEIKHPLFYATNGDHFTVWEDLPNGSVFAFDYLPENYPKFTVIVFEDVNEAVERAREMVEDEGWEVVKQRFSEDFDLPFPNPDD